jgi:alkaline phosphatase D
LYNFLINDSIDNAVVLTGDIHTAWANDLPLSNYVASTGANAAAVEFVTTSITSANVPLPVGATFVQTLNPHVKFVDLTEHGYYILNITPQRTQADYVFVSDITQKTYTSTIGPSWGSQLGSRHLDAGTLSTSGNYPPLAPFQSTTSGTQNRIKDDIINLSLFPNPFLSQIVLQFALRSAGPVQITLHNPQGQVVLEEDFADLPVGLHHVHFDGTHLAPGTYVLRIAGNNGAVASRVLKVER